MATKAGVWIDHKQATIVLLSATGKEIKKVVFDLGQPIHKIKAGRSNNTFTRNDFVAEDKLERKVTSDRKDYYGDVLAVLNGVSSVLILGPGEAKGELGKFIQSKKVRGMSVESETADKLTDRQLVVKVSQHFATGTKAKTEAKTKAPKKSVRSTQTKRAKKVAK